MQSVTTKPSKPILPRSVSVSSSRLMQLGTPLTAAGVSVWRQGSERPCAFFLTGNQRSATGGPRCLCLQTAQL